MINIDYKDRRPIYEQIVDRFKDLILKKILESNSQLPSVRQLAMDLSINPNTIQKAYTELERLGFIYTVKGKGCFIAVTDHLIQEKCDEIFCTVIKLINMAKSIGVTEELFVNKVKEGFKEEKGQ